MNALSGHLTRSLLLIAVLASGIIVARSPRAAAQSSPSKPLILSSKEPPGPDTWLLRTDNSERRQLSRELLGSYAWRDAQCLLVIPFRPDAQYHELWEIDVETGEARRPTDPAVTTVKAANADWQVSPDGRHVAFVESSDHSFWMLTLVD